MPSLFPHKLKGSAAMAMREYGHVTASTMSAVENAQMEAAKSFGQRPANVCLEAVKGNLFDTASRLCELEKAAERIADRLAGLPLNNIGGNSFSEASDSTSPLVLEVDQIASRLASLVTNAEGQMERIIRALFITPSTPR